MKKFAHVVAVAGVVLVALVATPALAAPTAELHITAEGKLSAKNIVVLQKSGTTLFCRALWGNAFVRLTVLTTPDTVSAVIVRNHGGIATIDEIQDGDLISVEGSLVPAADSLQINAKRIVDYSLNKEPKTLAGTIQSVGGGTFVLTNKLFNNTTVVVGTSTLTKGVRTITIAELVVKDKVLSAKGLYDYTTNTLTASSIEIFQDKAVFKQRAFEGTIRAISATTLPATVTIATAGADYMVYLPAGTKVLNKLRAPADLSRFAPGDKVAILGSIRQTNLAEVDAVSIRNLNF